MKRKYLFLLVWLLGAGYLIAENADSVIARARAAFGPEELLLEVQTLIYEGNLLNADGELEGRIKLFFRKPVSQRIEVTMGNTVDITVVNDFEGSIMRRDDEVGSSQRVVLNPQQVKRLHANSAENLNFFHGPLQQRGTIEYAGKAEKLGVVADQVVFEYPNGVRFERFFAPSGKLLATLVGNGENGRLELREEGGMAVDGIQFPARVLTYDGEHLIRIVEFERIQVNAPIDTDLFRFPKIVAR